MSRGVTIDVLCCFWPASCSDLRLRENFSPPNVVETGQAQKAPPPHFHSDTVIFLPQLLVSLSQSSLPLKTVVPLAWQLKMPSLIGGFPAAGVTHAPGSHVCTYQPDGKISVSHLNSPEEPRSLILNLKYPVVTSHHVSWGSAYLSTQSLMAEWYRCDTEGHMSDLSYQRTSFMFTVTSDVITIKLIISMSFQCQRPRKNILYYSTDSCIQLLLAQRSISFAFIS